VGNTQPVRVGLRQRRSRAGWQRSPGYAERRDSSTLAQISLALMIASVLLFLGLLMFAKFA
jgi:hypothetical protein